jgi:integrase
VSQERPRPRVPEPWRPCRIAPQHHHAWIVAGAGAAGVAVSTVDGNGKTIAKAKYSGLHALRHFYASWCINRKVEGGLELPPKDVQYRLGHATIAMTMDVHGHLFPKADSGAEMEAAERAFLGTTR